MEKKNTIAELFEAQAAERSDQIAVEYEKK